MNARPQPDKAPREKLTAERMILIVRVLFLAVLVVMGCIICASAFDGAAPFRLAPYLSIAAAAVLVLSAGCKIFPLPYRSRIAWYVVDSVFLVAYSVFSGVTYCYVVYALRVAVGYLSLP